MKTLITAALLIVQALSFNKASAAVGPLINGNQINPQTAISISTLTVTGTTGLATTKVAASGTIIGQSSITASSFFGPLVGNVTGNASGTALTVTQAAQAAITSLGTLTGLTMGGNLAMGANNITQSGNITQTGSGGYITNASSITANAFFGNGANLTNIPGASIAFSSAQFTSQTLTNTAFAGCNISGSTLTWTSTGHVAYITYNGMERLNSAGNHHSQVWIDGTTAVLGASGRQLDTPAANTDFFTGFTKTIKTSAGVHTICLGVFVNANTLTFCGDSNICEFAISEP